MTIKTHNSIGDLLDLPFHLFKKQYDEMVKFYQEQKRAQEEAERKAKAQRQYQSWSRPSYPSPNIPRVPRF